MAIIKTTSIVSEIIGSIGGSTFRRSPDGIMLYNKVKGASRNRLIQNQALARLHSVFNSWSALAESQKQIWRDNASKFERTTKTGVLVPYTGRQLFVLASITAELSGQTLVTPDAMNLPTMPLDFDVVCERAPKVMRIVNNISDDSDLIAISAYESRASSFITDIKRQRVIKVATYNASGFIEFYDEFSEVYGQPTADNRLHVVAYSINSTNWRSKKVSGSTIIQ